MTRESKLALIVGFGLILFVGILVSDHFSSGQRQEAAHLLAQRGAARAGRGAISIEPLPAAASTVNVSRRSEPQVTEVDDQPSQAGHAPTAPGARDHRDEEAGRSGDGRREIVIGPERTPQGDPARQETAPPRTPEQVADAGVRLYPVKEGETLYSICASQYGNGALWQALAAYNKAAVPNPARMRKGVTLKLPPIEVLRPGRGGAASDAGAASLDTPTPSRGASAVEQPGTTPITRASDSYEVQRGETLSDIARRKLGSPNRWSDIAKLNEDVIRDPHALKPGTVIRLPTSG